MSIGGPRQPTLDSIIAACIDLTGLVFVVAAGNEAEDACLVSPARVSSAITVGASNRSDTPADFR